MQVSLCDDSPQQTTVDKLVHGFVQILDASINHERHGLLAISCFPIDRLGGPDEQSSGRGRLQFWPNPPCENPSRVVINDRLDIRFGTVEKPKHPLKRRGRDGLTGLGDFRDLRRLLAFEVAR